MDTAAVTPIFLIVCAALAGASFAWLIRGREVAALRTKLSGSEATLSDARSALAAATERAAAFERERSGLDEKLGGHFATLAQDALDRASRTLLELAAARFGQEHQALNGSLNTRVQEIAGVLTPVREEFSKFAAAIGTLQNNSAHDLGALKQSIAQVFEMQSTLQEAVRTTNDATGRLQTALQNPRVAGNWGEISLDRIVALAGMTEHCDFERQTGMRSSDGSMEKPDVTVRLTGGLTIPIDAKASTANYIRAACEADEEERKRLLRQSVTDLKSRVAELRARAYDRIEGYAGMTLLFVPNESMLSAGLAQEPTLMEDALRYNIVICSPLLLLCYLRAFANGWRIQKQQDNAEEVARRGKMLHDRLQSFFTVLEKVGRYLNLTVERYNETIGKTGNLLAPGRELGKLLGLSEELRTIDTIDTSVRAMHAEASETTTAVTAARAS